MTTDGSLYSGAIGDTEKGGDSSGHGDRRSGGHEVALPPVTQYWLQDGRTWFIIMQEMEVRFRIEYRWWWDQEGVDLEVSEEVYP